MHAHQSFIDRLLYPYVRRCIETYEQAHDWTSKHCPACHSPIAFDGALYCAFCAARLTPTEAAPVVPSEATPPLEAAPHVQTDALYSLNQRPLQTFNAVLSQGRSIHTAMSAAIDIQKLRQDGKGKPQ